MSIRSCLKNLNTVKKRLRLPLLHQEPYRELPPSIAKTLDPLSSSPPSPAAALSYLSPSKLLQILADPAVKPTEGYQFFNWVLENRSSVSFIPDPRAHLTLVCRLLTVKRFPEAVNLFKSLIIDQKGSAVEIDERTCTLHLLVLKKNREMKLVLEFFHRMIKSGIEISPYSLAVVVGGLCENGKIRRCRELVEEMIGYGIKPNIVTFNIMLKACLKRWNFGQLELILALMKNQETPCDERTYKILIDGYVSSGKLEEAETMVLEMHDKGFGGDFHLWNLVRTRYCCLVDRAALLFDKMTLRDVTSSAATYCALINTTVWGRED
ncbi:unnamed protein product [Linum trigynum]|uniref:Pentatricopeptide repeat-containing protein n=1 Tax=Linum trigynum TaxID=586398 RepID=A0AAV2G0P7_9ROSI